MITRESSIFNSGDLICESRDTGKIQLMERCFIIFAMICTENAYPD